jgi:nucleoside-diphosphate-sugar epimerase
LRAAFLQAEELERAGMRVLVTGHLGYIGPVMVRKFKSAGHFVAGLDTAYFCKSFAADDPTAVPDSELIRDVREVTREDLQGFDCIVHLAALSNDPLGELAAELTQQINFAATLRIAKLAKAVGVRRFIFASSCSLYGASGSEADLSEDAALNPVSAYAVSKVQSEAALRELADDSFTPVFMRNATAYGVSPGMRFDLVLNNLFAWARTSGTIRVTSDGTPWRPLVHIEDISLAALCAAEAPAELVCAQAFNIGRSDANYRIREIAAIVAEHVPGAAVQITGESAGDRRSYRVCFDKAARHLPGFAPTWTVERGCVELKAWFDARHESVDSFQSARFIRLKHLRQLMSEGHLTPTLHWRSEARLRQA